MQEQVYLVLLLATEIELLCSSSSAPLRFRLESGPHCSAVMQIGLALKLQKQYTAVQH